MGQVAFEDRRDRHQSKRRFAAPTEASPPARCLGAWLARRQDMLRRGDAYVSVSLEQECNQHGPVQSAPPTHTWLQRKGFQIACLKHMPKSNQQIQTH